jgi:septal ring factor EnvC (AmiA/AmiB activator)
MDLQKIFTDPTVIVAIIGIASTILAAYIGRRERKVRSEEVEASTADKVSESYTKLVTSWELRLRNVQDEMKVLKEENREFRDQVLRLKESESVLNTRVHILEEKLAEITEERNLLAEERDLLWTRVAELERTAFSEEGNNSTIDNS